MTVWAPVAIFGRMQEKQGVRKKNIVILTHLNRSVINWEGSHLFLFGKNLFKSPCYHGKKVHLICVGVNLIDIL